MDRNTGVWHGTPCRGVKRYLRIFHCRGGGNISAMLGRRGAAYHTPPPLEAESLGITQAIEKIGHVAKLVAAAMAFLLSAWLARCATVIVQRGGKKVAQWSGMVRY